MHNQSVELQELKLIADKVVELANNRPTNRYLKNSASNMYQKCLYFLGKCSDGSDGCLLGQAIKDMYEPNSKLISVMKFNPDLHIMGVLSMAGFNLYYPKNRMIAKWLCAVQQKQDVGMSWATCIKGYKGS